MNDQLNDLHAQMADLYVELFSAVAKDLTADGHKAFDYLAEHDMGGEVPPKGAPKSPLELLRRPFTHENSDLAALQTAMSAIERYFFGGDPHTLADAERCVAGLERAALLVKERAA